MVTMKVAGLSIDEGSKIPLLILRHEESEQMLAIWISTMEAMSISLALGTASPQHPVAHDLLLSVIENLKAELVGVDIVDMQKGTFFAKLTLAVQGRRIQVDARPADAVALAIRAHVPILVAETVLQHAVTGHITPPAPIRNSQDDEDAPEQPQQMAWTAEQSEKLNESDLAELLRVLYPETNNRM